MSFSLAKGYVSQTKLIRRYLMIARKAASLELSHTYLILAGNYLYPEKLSRSDDGFVEWLLENKIVSSRHAERDATVVKVAVNKFVASAPNMSAIMLEEHAAG